MGEESMNIDDTVADWESGLPSVADLTPLSQSLIPAELASAFRITSEPPRTMLEVNRASQSTFSSLNSAPNLKPYDDLIIDSTDLPDELLGSDPKRNRAVTDDDAIDNSQGGKAVKRPRLVWTPQLHKRFVDVVAHLGLKNAVPKTIMHLMNVEGLTRENVASHLQKYRLYVKRMQGLSNEGPSPSDNLFASTPLPPAQSFNESSSGQVNSNRSHGTNNNGASVGHIGMQLPIIPMTGNGGGGGGGFNGYDAGSSLHHHHHYHHHYQQQFNSMAQQQQRDWSANNNKYNSSNA